MLSMTTRVYSLVLVICTLVTIAGARTISDTIPPSDSMDLLINTIDVTPDQLGDFHHPLQLVRGRIAGMHITRPGGSINDHYTIRSRGVHSFHFENTRPQYLVNDMPIRNIQVLNLQDIHSISFELGAAKISHYAMRNAQSILHFKTNPSEVNEGLMIQYNNYLNRMRVFRNAPVLTADEYISKGGSDYGERNDFQQAILRTGSIHNHNLAIQRKWQNTQLIASGQWQNIKPVLQQSGTRNLKGHITLRQSFFRDRIRFDLGTFYYSAEHEYGVPDAARFANNRIPTIPIHDENSPYNGYFEDLKFNYYNPVSIVQQVRNNASEIVNLYQLGSTVNLGKRRAVNIQYGKESKAEKNHHFAPSSSLYLGNWQDGYVEKSSETFANDWFDVHFSNRTSILNRELFYKIGYNYQQENENIHMFSGSNFDVPVDASTSITSAKNKNESQVSFLHRTLQFYGNTTIKTNRGNNYILHINRSGSSRLGRNNQWGWFWGITSNTNLHSLTKKRGKNTSRLLLSYGRTGMAPPRDNMGQLVIVPRRKVYYEGQYRSSVDYQYGENQNLSWEKRNEFEIKWRQGIKQDKFLFTYSRYWGRSADLIYSQDLPHPSTFARYRYNNQPAIRNVGWELSFSTRVLRKKHLTWNLRFNAFRFKPILDEFGSKAHNVGGRCGCGNVYAPQTIVEGEPLGTIRTWRTRLENDKLHEVDYNFDNNLDYKDQIVSGNSFARMILNVRQSVSWKKFSLIMSIRSAWGHSLVHENRLELEDINLLDYYNIIQTKHFSKNPGRAIVFTDDFVESGNYLLLDQLFMTYNLSKYTGKHMGKFDLYFGGQNLILLTTFSGIDPEVRYHDTRYSPQGRPHNTDVNAVVAGGYENEHTFPLFRTVYVGISISF